MNSCLLLGFLFSEQINWRTINLMRSAKGLSCCWNKFTYVTVYKLWVKLNSGLKFFLSRLILHFHLLWIRARRQTKLRICQQLATKLVETLCPEGAFWCFTDFKGQSKAFPPPFPPCNVLPLFKLHTENNEHPNRERRRGVWILLFSEVTLFFKYNVSTFLSPIVG